MNEFKFQKGFRVTVFVLVIVWLAILSANLISPQIGHTSVFEADENFVAQDFTLSEDDYKKIAALKANLSEDDANGNAKLRAEKAVEAYNRGDFENAIALYNEALALGEFKSENDLVLLMNLALAYEAMGDSRNAIATYRTVQSKSAVHSPSFNVAKAKIALISEFMDVKTAVNAFKETLILDPENFEANNTLALIYMGEYGSEFTNFQKALEYNTKMEKIAPTNTNVRINLAINFIELGQLAYARDHLEYVLEVQPQSLPANYLMMKALHLNKKSLEAKPYAEKLVGWYPDFTEDKLVAEVLGNQ